MSQHLAQSFVDLSGRRLTSQAVAKLRLDHVECRFDVAALVITLHEAILVVRIEMEHSFPKRVVRVGLAFSDAIALERDIGHRVMVNDRLQIVARQVGFVGAHLAHSEVASRGLNQSLELRRVGTVRVSNLNAGYDVRFDSAHQMHLDPVVLLHEFRIGIFCLGPLNEAASCEAGRINGEVAFNGLQGQTANLNQLFQERRQRRILKVARDRSVVRRSRQEPFAVRVSKVRAKATARERRVNFEGASEDHISQRNARTPERLDRLFDTFAEFVKQGKKTNRQNFRMRLRRKGSKDV